MVDELKSLKDTIKKALLNNVNLGEEELSEHFAATLAKSFVNQVLAKAGKSKDDIVQILAREIGFAMAAVLKEPLDKLVESKKLQISVELVGKSEIPPTKKKKKKKTKKSVANKNKKSSKSTAKKPKNS